MNGWDVNIGDVRVIISFVLFQFSDAGVNIEPIERNVMVWEDSKEGCQYFQKVNIPILAIGMYGNPQH